MREMILLPRLVRKLHTLVFAAVLALLLCSEAAGQQLAVKANALSWIAGTPDVGLELITGEKTSVGMSVFGHYKPYGIDSSVAALQPEFRFWFNGRPLTREYVGLCGIGAIYDMHFNACTYQGSALGLGLSGGYLFNLGSRWSLDLSFGTGLVWFRQKEYRDTDRYNDYYKGTVSPVNNQGYKIFPVKLAVSFVYIIL